MPDLSCPNCGARVTVEDASFGSTVLCSRCGASVKMGQHFGDVIDVHAEVLSGDQEAAEPAGGAEIVARRPPSPGSIPPEGDARTFTWVYESTRGGPGCCSCGCLLLLVLFALAVQGFFSLVQ